MSKAIVDIKKERDRQWVEEHFTNEKDDRYIYGELGRAAACYILISVPTPPPIVKAISRAIELLWPWDASWWKPKTKRENLVRAGALIAAEIDRLDRLEEVEKRIGQRHVF